MQVRHRIAAATLLGCAALSGTYALSQTIHLGADAKKVAPVDAAALAQRNAALDAAEKSAQEALARKTPPLPSVPEVGPVPVPTLPPIVIPRGSSRTRHRSGVSSHPRTRRSAPAPAVPAASSGSGAKRPRAEGSEAEKHRREVAAEAAKKQREGSDRGGDEG
jgi:hypothetical protein